MASTMSKWRIILYYQSFAWRLLAALVCLYMMGCGRGQSSSTQSKPFSKPYAESYTNGIGMKFALIPAGEFQMGSQMSVDELAQRFKAEKRFLVHEQPPHAVKISSPFYIGVTEVTQAEWHAVMGNRPWAGQGEGAGSDPKCAASYITFADANEFCRRLSKLDGLKYRLPTEAEWEYAARGGSSALFFFGDDPAMLGEYGWYSDNAKGVQPVGKLKPNGYGLYDTCGNVFEWCSDWYSAQYYSFSPPVDPTGPGTGQDKIVRGGSWFNSARFCRSAFRSDTTTEKFASDVGFRIVLSIE